MFAGIPACETRVFRDGKVSPAMKLGSERGIWAARPWGGEGRKLLSAPGASGRRPDTPLGLVFLGSEELSGAPAILRHPQPRSCSRSPSSMGELSWSGKNHQAPVSLIASCRGCVIIHLLQVRTLRPSRGHWVPALTSCLYLGVMLCAG